MTTTTFSPTRLADLTQRWDAFYRAVEEAGGVLTPEMEAQHECLHLDTADKVDGYMFRLHAFEGQAAALKALEGQIADRRKALEREVQRLEDRVRLHMDTLKLTELRGEMFQGFKVQRAGGVQALEILVVDPLAWPEQYQVTTVTLDTEKIRAAVNPEGKLLVNYDSEPKVVAQLRPRGKVLRRYI